MSPLAFALWTALVPAPPRPPHGGLLAAAGARQLELVVGPDRFALYPLDEKLQPVPLAGAQAELLKADGSALPTTAAADHWEAPNPSGTATELTLLAVVRDARGAISARFDFRPGQASTFHDHSPLHGGQVGMAGERHLELAAVAVGGEEELQLYLTDAYRQPLALAGVSGSVAVRVGQKRLPLALVASGDCLTARLAKPSGPLDVHVQLEYPDAPREVEMDFYLERSATSVAGAPVTVRVGAGGFAPSRIEGRAGVPLTLRFLRTTDQTCATRVVFPELGLERELPLQQPVDVRVIPRAATLSFACGMGMFKGAVVAR